MEGDDDAAHPILSKMVSLGYQGGPVIASFKVRDTAEINNYLRMPQVRSLLPAEFRYAKFVWGIPVMNQHLKEETTDLDALKCNRENIPRLGCHDVVDARQ